MAHGVERVQPPGLFAKAKESRTLPSSPLGSPQKPHNLSQKAVSQP